MQKKNKKYKCCHSESLFPSPYFSELELYKFPAMCHLHLINREHNAYDRRRCYSMEARIP